MKYIFKYAAIAISIIFMASCSSDEDWQPGPKTKEGCQQVYFPSSNETVAIIDDTNPDDRTIEVTVARMVSEGTLTVPITTVSKSEGVQIPSEVTFADGSLTSSLSITVPTEIEKGTAFEYSLQIEGDEVDPYAQLPGGSKFTGLISCPIDRIAKMWVSGAEDVLGYWHETITDMGGGRYKIQDLMDSGIELDIKVDDKNNITLSGPQLSEVYPNYWYSGDCYIYFNEYNPSTGYYDYYTFYPHGKDAYIWIKEMCMYTYGEWNYSYYEPNEKYFSISACWLQLNTEKAAREWQELRFKFIEDGEEFEDYLPEDEPLGEEVIFTASFDYYNDTFGGSFNITATKVGDNGYLFEDFLGCGDDITMTINRETGEVSFEGLYSQYWDGLFYLMTSNGYGAKAYPNKGVSENFINYIYFYTLEGTDYVKWNEETKTFELGTYFWLNEDYDTSYWDTLYLKLNE